MKKRGTNRVSTPLLFKRLKTVNVLIIVVPLIFILIVFAQLINGQQRYNRQQYRLTVLNRLSTIRAQIENTLNNNLLPLRGMLTQIALHNGITYRDFRNTAQALLAYPSDIRHLSLLRGTTIKFVYPLAINTNAIGIDLADNPEQRETVLRAIRERQTILTGPVKLVQGGTALIGRMPIFISEPGTPINSGPYWGQISIAIDMDSFVRSAQLDKTDDLHIALRRYGSSENDSTVIYGDQAVFQQNPVSLAVSLPHGEWQLAAIPAGGWATDTSFVWLWRTIALLSIIVWLLISSLLVRHISRHRRVSDRLQEVNLELENRVAERTRALADKQAQLVHAGRLASLGEMATAIAHEIGQPLQIIKTSTGIIREDMRNDRFDPEQTRLLVQKIVENVDRAAAIIQNVRNFARQDSKPDCRRQHITTPVREAVSLFNAQFRQHEIYLQMKIDDDLPPMRMPPQKMQQIIVNLLSNARYAVEERASKAEPDFKKSVTLRLFSRRSDDRIILEVQDNGTGMDQATREHCMDPFFTTKPMGEGTGLGLSILHGIVKDFDGTIEIESAPGGGTTFRITFPPSE
jgi:sensor domain CHASE-containing protein/nitrogen-specific signal transduction histidine kinase